MEEAPEGRKIKVYVHGGRIEIPYSGTDEGYQMALEQMRKDDEADKAMWIHLGIWNRHNSKADDLELAKQWIPEYGHEYIETTFDGDVEAAFRLVGSCHDYQQANLARLLWNRKVSPPAFREVLRCALDQSHAYSRVRNAAGSRAGLVKWLRYTQFELPASMADTVKIYRGFGCNINVTARKGSQGVSWSTHFVVASHFAAIFGHEAFGKKPVVLMAEVPKSEIVFYSNEIHEKEVMTAHPIKTYSIIADITRIERAAAKWHRVVFER